MHKLVKELTMMINGDIAINEVVDEKSMAVLRKELATPSIMPHDFDRTMSGWLTRVEFWGRVNYFYIEPGKKTKTKVTKNRMLTRMEDLQLNRMLGKWEFKHLSTTSVEASRTFRDIDDKDKTEKFIISVDLRPELKGAVKSKWGF